MISQPIVPLDTLQTRRFESNSRNDVLLKIRPDKLELTLFQCLNQDWLEAILNKVLGYDNPTQ